MRIGLAMGIVCLLGACGGDGSEPEGGAGAGFRVQVVPNEAGAGREVVTFQADDGTSFTVLEARAAFRHVELKLPDGIRCSDVEVADPLRCDDDDDGERDDGSSAKLVVEGPFVVDLLTGETTPDLSTARVPTGVYERVDYRIEDADPEDGVVAASDPLAGVSLVLRATSDRGSLTVRLRFNEDVRIEAPAGIEVASDGALVAALRLDAWFDDVPLSECIEEAGGDVVIDEDASGECGDLEPALKDNIKNSGQLLGE
ncbi:MAG: hypothetical protein HYY06_30290 [Deltaproteobacteria bacterium]|nr:hypothetical protein [Deltaproteobacteria bacterium]